MPQPSFRRLLHESYLRHQLRPHPLHLPHLVSRHAAAPAGRLIGVAWLQRPEDLATQVRHEASSHLACEPQAGIILADEQGIDSVRPGAVAVRRSRTLAGSRASASASPHCGRPARTEMSCASRSRLPVRDRARLSQWSLGEPGKGLASIRSRHTALTAVACPELTWATVLLDIENAA
jgi:hypothetical protein